MWIDKLYAIQLEGIRKITSLDICRNLLYHWATTVHKISYHLAGLKVDFLSTGILYFWEVWGWLWKKWKFIWEIQIIFRHNNFAQNIIQYIFKVRYSDLGTFWLVFYQVIRSFQIFHRSDSFFTGAYKFWDFFSPGLVSTGADLAWLLKQEKY